METPPEPNQNPNTTSRTPEGSQPADSEPVNPVTPNGTEAPVTDELLPPTEVDESESALSGLKRFVLMARRAHTRQALASTRETLTERRITDDVVKNIPIEARVIRGFGTSKKKAPRGPEPGEPDTRTDSERKRDEILESHNRGVEDPTADKVPVSLYERLTSAHRQRQVHKLRAIDREKAEFRETHGRSALIRDLTDADLVKLGYNPDKVLDDETGETVRDRAARDILDPKIHSWDSAAVVRATEASIKKALSSKGKVLDSDEDRIERIYGEPYEGQDAPRMRGYQVKSEKKAIKLREELDEEAEELEERLHRGTEGNTLPGKIRRALIARSERREQRLREKLNALSIALGEEPEEPNTDPEAPEGPNGGPRPAPSTRPERNRGVGHDTEEDVFRDILFREPAIDREALEALTDEEREDLAKSLRAIRLVGHLAPKEVLDGLSDEDRKLLYMTTEMRLREFVDAKVPNGFKSFDAGWVKGDGSIQPVRVVGVAKPTQAMEKTEGTGKNKKVVYEPYVYIAGSKLPIPLKLLVVSEESKAGIDLSEPVMPDTRIKYVPLTQEVLTAKSSDKLPSTPEDDEPSELEELWLDIEDEVRARVGEEQPKTKYDVKEAFRRIRRELRAEAMVGLTRQEREELADVFRELDQKAYEERQAARSKAKKPASSRQSTDSYADLQKIFPNA